MSFAEDIQKKAMKDQFFMYSESESTQFKVYIYKGGGDVVMIDYLEG